MHLSFRHILEKRGEKTKLPTLFFVFSAFFVFLTLFLIKGLYGQILPTANAYEPFPPPYVPCNETRPQEFHSLRPYQASPCNQDAEDLALFCGDDFILVDRIVIDKIYSTDPLPGFGEFPIDWVYEIEGEQVNPVAEQPPEAALACNYCNSAGQCVPNTTGPCIPEFGCQSPGDCDVAECTVNDDGTETCTFVVDRVNDIAIDLANTDFPIMGFTEPSRGSGEDPKVVNSLNQNENLSDADKVNEYVSWYLNGVIGRAEYDPPDTETEEGNKRIVDFSGPLKKLLAFESQIVRRIEEVEKAETSINVCVPNSDPSDPDCIRHDQIIGCHVLGIPFTCYPGGAARLRLSYWIDNYPPLRRAFNTFEDYITAYETWRNTFRSRLFSYIPFSSTEDRLGEAEIATYSVQPALYSNILILHSAITNQVPADLFFAHMQESYELADILQSLFSYQDADLNADPLNVNPIRAPYCNIAEVRKNPGDDLFATEIRATVEYTAQITCSFTHPGVNPDTPTQGRLCNAAEGTCYSGSQGDWSCGTYYNQVDCPSGYFCGKDCGGLPELPTGQPCNSISGYECFPSDWDGCTTIYDPTGYLCPPPYVCGTSCSPPPPTISEFNYTETCENNVYVAFRTVTKTPLAEEVWSKLVSGPAGVFRRIFPQIEDEEGRPIRRLWDIPAATSVVYRSLTGNVTVAGGPNRQLYFPHIGGVHEYFLNCIQKTLRPQGFGQGCVTGPPPLSNITGEGSCANPPPTGAWANAGGCTVPDSGLCSPGSLAQFGFSGCRARQAAIICNGESGGNPSAINCGCLTGSTVDYSVGLFQINLLAHSAGSLRCYDAFEYSCSYSWCENQGPVSCTILDQDVVDQCASYYFDAGNNASYAYKLSGGGTNWTPWAVYNSCRTQVDAQCQ